MRKNITIILLISLIFVLGMRGRYGPFIWQTVSGGIQYIGGNVTLTNGDLTIATGDSFIVGTTTWTSSDEIDGTKIKDADYGDIIVSAGGAWALDDVSATYEVQLNNEVGLYAVLSDVSDFVQPTEIVCYENAIVCYENEIVMY